MSYKIIKQVPSGKDIIKQIPLSESGYARIAKDRWEIQNILSGKDDRKLIVVGPCSAWPEGAVLDYAKRLLAINERVKHKLKIVMRAYIQKPRTVRGWSGPLNQPDLLTIPDIEAGMRYVRSLMVKIVEMGLPIADEALFTHNSQGFLELLSWVAIGARSSEDQEHRVFASMLDCAVGIKNPTSGSVRIGINGVVAAQHPHTAVFDGYEVETSGNDFAHLVLRGGIGGPNYSVDYLGEAVSYIQDNMVKNPAIIIDVSHDNSIINGKKDYRVQAKIILDIVHNLKSYPEYETLVKGFMLESFIKDGRQDVTDASSYDAIDMSGLSITDACLGWEQTEELLLALAGV